MIIYLYVSIHIRRIKMDTNEMRQLIAEVEQGSQEAFTKLYEMTSRTVYFICISFLNNEEDAKDVMQDVYITAYNYLPQLIEKEKFQAWINQIAVNKCKRFLMKDMPIPVEDEYLANTQLEENENFLPEEYITKKAKRKIVMDIMRQCLSDIQYETVILYYFNGLSIEEVADIMECPPGTVKYRLSVARGKIKEGVLAYENKNDDKLYSFAAVPFLASLLAAEANGIQVPYVLPNIIHFLMNQGAATVASEVASAVASGDGYETIGTATTNVVANSTATTVTKAGIGALKVKLAIGVAALAVVGVGVVAILGGKKDDGNKSTEDVNIDIEHVGEYVESSESDEVEEPEVPESKEFSGDWTVEEEYGYTPFWLKYSGLSALEDKDMSSLQVYNSFNCGEDLNVALARFNYFVLYDETGSRLYEGAGYDALLEYSGTFHSGADLPMIQPSGSSWDEVIICAQESEDRESNMVEFYVINSTDKEVTLKDCIENGEFYTEAYNIAYMYDMGTDYANFRTEMSETINMFGKPTGLYATRNMLMNTDREESEETFEETVEKGGGMLIYSLIYDEGDYLIRLEFSETNYYGKYEGYAKLSYYTPGAVKKLENTANPVYEPEKEMDLY